MRIIRRTDLTKVPWRNNGGITRDIAESKTDRALIWRLSLADVTRDGPFSSFRGLTRVLTVVQGNGLDLIGPGGILAATIGGPVQFDGALNIRSRLRDGPVRNLNLMFDPMRCHGEVSRLSGEYRQVFHPGPGMTIALHCVEGTAKIGPDAILSPGDTGIIEDGTIDVDLDRSSVALLVRLTLPF